jgi:hypothetical protein
MGLAASALAATGVVGHGGAALAEPPPAPATDDADVLVAYLRSAATTSEAFDRLTPTQRQAVRDRVLVAYEEDVVVDDVGTLAAAAAGEQCWNRSHRRNARAVAGNVIYTHWQGLKVCAKNGAITSGKVYDRGGETSTPGWSYLGNGGSGKQVFGNQLRSYTQEKFRLQIDIGPVHQTVQSPTPCVQIRVNAKGGTTRGGSCYLGG